MYLVDILRYIGGTRAILGRGNDTMTKFLHDTRTSTPTTKEFDDLDPDVSQYPKTEPGKRIVARVEVK